MVVLKGSRGTDASPQHVADPDPPTVEGLTSRRSGDLPWIVSRDVRPASWARAVLARFDEEGRTAPSRRHRRMMSPRKRNTGSQAVRTGRWMARRDEPFAVFLFGMRLNRLRGLPRFLWGLRVLRRVLRDLEAHPQRGYVAGRVYRTGRTLVAVQYWESFDALDAWARDHRLPHRRPWQQYLREALDDGAMGLWHETYLASPGGWEGVYLNMPPWGLAAGVEAVEMQTTKGSARERLREQRKRAGRAAAEKTPPPPP